MTYRRMHLFARLVRLPLMILCILVLGWWAWGHLRRVQSERGMACASNGYEIRSLLFRWNGAFTFRPPDGAVGDSVGTVQCDVAVDEFGPSARWKRTVTMSVPRLAPSPGYAGPMPTPQELQKLCVDRLTGTGMAPWTQAMPSAVPGKTVVYFYNARLEWSDFLERLSRGIWGPACAGASVMLGIFLLRRATRRFMKIDGRCVQCGYDVRGLSGPACPECGTCREV